MTSRWRTECIWQHGNKLATEFACNIRRVATVAGVATPAKDLLERNSVAFARASATDARILLHGVSKKTGNTGNSGNTYEIVSQSVRSVWQQVGNTGNKMVRWL